MNIHIVFKGSLRGSWPLFQKNFETMIAKPLLDQGHKIKISAFLWEEENNKEFKKLMEFSEFKEYPLHLMEVNPYTTLKGMFDDVLNFCRKECLDGDEDYYLILRPDILYKSPIDLHLDFNKDFDIMLPNKEYEIHWITHRRVGDSFYVIRGEGLVFRRILMALNDFKLIKESADLYQTDETYLREHLTHHWFDSLIKQNLKVDFLLDGYYDSNTYHKSVVHLDKQILAPNKNPFFISGAKSILDDGLYYVHDDVDIDGLILGEKKLNYEKIKTIYR